MDPFLSSTHRNDMQRHVRLRQVHRLPLSPRCSECGNPEMIALECYCQFTADRCDAQTPRAMENTLTNGLVLTVTIKLAPLP